MQANHDKFSAFIEGSKTFVVPVYQRNYDWTVANCKQLFADMTEAVDKNKPHFVGTIVHQKNSVDDIYQEFVIIDGQQRITSLILFARALCDFADENLRDDLRSAFIVHTRGRLRGKCKLRPTEFDAPTFTKIIGGETNFTDDEKKIRHVQELRLLPRGRTAIRNLKFVIATASSFHIPNYKFHIELLRPSGNVENFITQYMITRRKSNAVKQEQLSNRKLYAPFKEFFGKYFGTARTEDFLRELLRYAKVFRRCIFDESDEFNELPALEQKFYELTFLLKATNAPIILMYLLDRHEQNHFDEATFIKFVDALISLAFRSKACGKSLITQQFAGNVLARLDKSPLTVENFWKAITFGKGDRAFPSDATFQAALTSSELPDRLKTNDCKYFLYATERQKQTANLPAYSSSVVEEILPSKPNVTWKNYLRTRGDSQAAEAWSKTLGNLTLVESKVGSKDLFNIKKARYAQSSFSCTRALTSYSDWTSKQIQARAKRLAVDALKIWTLPEKFNAVVQRNENIFTLDDDFSKLTGKKPATLSIAGNEIQMPTWIGLLREIVRQLYALDKDAFRRAAQQDNVRKSLFTATPTERKIDDGFYMTSGFDTKVCLTFAKVLTENFDALKGTNFKSEIWFTLRAAE